MSTGTTPLDYVLYAVERVFLVLINWAAEHPETAAVVIPCILLLLCFLPTALGIIEGNRWRSRYARYLVSPEWRELREQCFERDNDTCRICGWYTQRPHAHHVSYQEYNRTGHTPLSDVITVCANCHQKVHERMM